MENYFSSLPNDPDRKKVAAASLTTAVTILVDRGVPVSQALQSVADLYLVILGEKPASDTLANWDTLGG